MIDRTKFVLNARALLNTPFRHMGRNKFGVDCAGLVKLAAAMSGTDLKDMPLYGREPWRNGLEDVLERNFGARVSNAEYGCVGLFKEPELAHASHIGIFGDYGIDNLSLIHCYGEVGRVVEHIFDRRWRNKLVGVYLT